MKNIFFVLLLFAALCLGTKPVSEIHAQTATHQFSAGVFLTNPQYSIELSLWNPLGSGKVLYVDKVEINTGIAITSAETIVAHGSAFGKDNNNSCTPVPIMPSTVGTTSVAMVLGQPCSSYYLINNLPGAFDYTVNTPYYGQHISIPPQPIAVQPGWGYDIFCSEAYTGQESVLIWWHE